MKKKKIIVTTILLGVSIILIALSVYATTSNKTQKIAYTNEDVAYENDEEIDLQEENENIIDDEIENTDNEITVEQPVEEIAETVTAQPVQEQKKTTTQSSAIKSSSQTTASKSSQTTTVIQPQTSTAIQEQQKQTQSQLTQSSQPVQEKKTPFWCVDGGTHHILGDGANEHGYYKTWDKAFSAYEEYTTGWESTQFKVAQCDCGLYYFWAIK